MGADPKRTKKADNLAVFFAILGTICVKAVYKMLMKLTLDFFISQNKG